MESQTKKIKIMAEEQTKRATLNRFNTDNVYFYGKQEKQSQENIEPINDFIKTFPYTLANFFSNYEQLFPILLYGTLGLISAYITLAILEGINEIPLLGSCFQLIGLGYSIWFFVRYLLFASTRQELRPKIEYIKANLVEAQK